MAAALLVSSCSDDGLTGRQDRDRPAASDGNSQNRDQSNNGPGGQEAGSQAAAGLGDPITLTGFGRRSQVTVTSTEVSDPAYSSDQAFDKPSRGNRFVAVQFRLENTGQKVYADAPDNGAVLIDDKGQQFNTTFLSGTPNLGPTFASPLKVLPGATALGVVVFEVPLESRPAAVQFGLDSGFSDTGQWELPNLTGGASLKPFAGDIFTVDVLQVATNSVSVQFCATAPYESGPIPVTRARWSVVGDNGVTYGPIGDSLPGDYPAEASVAVGQCVQGNVRVRIPSGVAITQVLYQSTLGSTQWRVR